MKIKHSLNDLKVALKFKPRAFDGKLYYETQGKIKQKLTFPLEIRESSFVILNSIELLNVLDNGIMDLLCIMEKATYVISGDIKDVFTDVATKIRLTKEGEVSLIEGKPIKFGLQGTVIFPQRFVSAGDFWENSILMELPYFSVPFNVMVRSSLERFELWEDEKICAVIENNFYGQEERPNGKFHCKEIIYFDYEAGKMLKSNFKMKIISNIFGITLDIEVNNNIISKLN